MPFSLVFLLAFPLLCTAQHLNLAAGSKCDDVGGICTRLDGCSTVNVKLTKPKTCSFQGSMPVVCCPPARASPFSIMCIKYSSESCVTPLGRTTFVKRSAPPEDEFQVVGGVFSRPREHVNMTHTSAFFRHVIVGGKNAPARLHRHMALIGYGEDVSKAEWLCGGSIITNNFILTAAHCARTPSLGLARWVRVGDLDTSTSLDDARPLELEVAERLVHPQYRAPMAYHDIALFRLAADLIFNAWVGPACLAPPSSLPTSATATGWGRTDIAADTSSHLLEVDLTLVDGGECRRLLGNSTTVPKGIDPQIMMCAGEVTGGKDTCSGDSGGPLVTTTAGSCLKTQLGVISFGRLCALPNSPGVYTKVAHYLPWIESVIWSSSD